VSHRSNSDTALRISSRCDGPLLAGVHRGERGLPERSGNLRGGFGEPSAPFVLKRGEDVASQGLAEQLLPGAGEHAGPSAGFGDKAPELHGCGAVGDEEEVDHVGEMFNGIGFR